MLQINNNEHDISHEYNFLILLKNTGRHTIDLTGNRHTTMFGGLALQCTQIGTKNMFSHCDVCPADGKLAISCESAILV